MNSKDWKTFSDLVVQDIKIGTLFRAQFKGVYFFSYLVTTSDSYPSTVVHIMKNKQVVAASVVNSGSQASLKYSVHVKATLLLEAGDQVTVQDYKQETNGSLSIIQPSSISGNNNAPMLQLNKVRGSFSAFLLSNLS